MGKGTRPRGRPALPAGAGLGQRLRAERLRAGLTLSQLGGSEYAPSYIGNVEHGRATPSLEALEYFAQRLGISVVDLIVVAAEPLRPREAVGRAQRLLVDAQQTASPEERQILAAASLMLGALRRHLAGE